MPSRELVSHSNKIESLIVRIDNYARSDSEFELQADLAKYACVQVAGYLEKALYYILYDYTKRHSDPRLQRFAVSRLRGFTNASSGKIEKLLEEFDKDWGLAITGGIDYEELKMNINGLIKERHLIAHGEDSAITLSRVRQYYKGVQSLVNYIDKIVNK